MQRAVFRTSGVSAPRLSRRCGKCGKLTPTPAEESLQRRVVDAERIAKHVPPDGYRLPEREVPTFNGLPDPYDLASSQPRRRSSDLPDSSDVRRIDRRRHDGGGFEPPDGYRLDERREP